MKQVKIFDIEQASSALNKAKVARIQLGIGTSESGVRFRCTTTRVYGTITTIIF